MYIKEVINEVEKKLKRKRLEFYKQTSMWGSIYYDIKTKNGWIKIRLSDHEASNEAFDYNFVCDYNSETWIKDILPKLLNVVSKLKKQPEKRRRKFNNIFLQIFWDMSGGDPIKTRELLIEQIQCYEERNEFDSKGYKLFSEAVEELDKIIKGEN